LPCVSCGADTEERALFCGRCFGRITDPLVLLPRALDPVSDMRLLHVISPCLRIGPLSTDGIILNKGIDPVMRLREIDDEMDTEVLASLIDLTLSALGIGLHLWGDEIIPYRESTWKLMAAAENRDADTEIWARSCVRMGNVLALLLREVKLLPVEKAAKEEFIERMRTRATGLFEKADPFPSLRWISISNQALMEHWSGDSSSALSLLRFALNKEIPRDERYRLEMKRAMVLIESGRKDEAAMTLDSIPPSVEKTRFKKIRRLLEEL